MSGEKHTNRPAKHGKRGFGPGRPAEKAKDFKGTVKKLLRYMAKYKVALFFVAVFAVCSTVFNVVGPRILSQATTELFNGSVKVLQGTGGIDFAKIGKILLVCLTIYLTSALMGFLQGFIMVSVSQKMTYRMREEISLKIHRLPMAYFESKTVGEILSRITNDVDTLGSSMSQAITQVVTSVTTMIGVIAMMLSISPMMTLIALAILPISLGLVALVVRASQKYFVAQQKYLGKINGQIEETFSGQSIVRVFNQEENEIERFDEKNMILYHSAWKSQFLSGLMQPIMNFVGNMAYVAVAIVGSMLAVSGVITVGDIQAFIQYVKNFTSPIMQMSMVANMLQSMVAAAERVFEFLEESEESQDEQLELNAEQTKGAVSFEHVRFGYHPDKIIIHDFSCEVDPGEMVAIVGPTGAGKTTMIKLLMRFYDVNQGAIKVDGNDIRQFKRGNLRENFGMVLQDTWLFQGTIMENIRYGKLGATDEEVMEAAKAAHAHHFIETLPGGYQFELNEDASNVSQGQRQLLTIARAVLADNPILILDEATSSVDTRTEQQIQKAMNQLMKGRTSFVIAHRLSTIKDADMILVMKDGDIIEQGNHEELLAKNGFYADLYNSQFEEIGA